MKPLTLPQFEPTSVGQGADIRINNINNSNRLANPYYFEGFLLQLNENGLLMRTDKTDPIYRRCVWHAMGLKGDPPSWDKIYNMLARHHRDVVAKILIKASYSWLNFQNENFKIFIKALSMQRITLREFKMILGSEDFDLYYSRLLDASNKIDNYKNIFNNKATIKESAIEEEISKIQNQLQE